MWTDSKVHTAPECDLERVWQKEEEGGPQVQGNGNKDAKVQPLR